MARRVPIAGPRAAGLVGLSPRVRHILARRARRQAQRSIGPEVRAARAGYRPVRRAYRQNVRSAKSAVALSEGLLASQTKALKASGLRGSALRQTQQEFAARSGDLATSLPFLTSEARATRQADMAGVQQDVLKAKAARKHTAGEILNSLLGSARTHAASALKQRTASGGKGKEFHQAVHVAKLNYLQGPSSGPKNAKGAVRWRPPYSNKGDWALFVTSILHAEGVTDASVAERAAKRAVFEELNAQHTRNGFKPVSRKFFDRWLRAQLGG